MGIVTPFSIDLIAAVMRQRGFTDKMVRMQWNPMEAVPRAVARYAKFLGLINGNRSKFLVPTLDIGKKRTSVVLLVFDKF
ncbi:hypothetical protein BC937DRAFT_93359 [Endogone sp. FLAS-F59071]|nr:hypothetical protein BC937DRAFT_93359 [Endogone sp. FLAS-F59071]|eukprot:RUS21198.1 hypothetical protein BC937DRAFT_93359 [Endogone sp. FLAS-F59071]